MYIFSLVWNMIEKMCLKLCWSCESCDYQGMVVGSDLLCCDIFWYSGVMFEWELCKSINVKFDYLCQLCDLNESNWIFMDNIYNLFVFLNF